MSNKSKTVYERIDDLEKIIASLKKDAGKPQDLAKDVTALKRSVTALKRSVTALKADTKSMASASHRAEPSEAGLGDMIKVMADMEENISSLKSDMAMIKTIFRSKLMRYEIRAVREGRDLPSTE